MAAPEYITVKAPPGKTTPIHPSDGHPISGPLLIALPDRVIRVRFAGSQNVRRSIGRGDLIMCDMNGAPVSSAELAASPDELPGGCVRIAERKAP